MNFFELSIESKIIDTILNGSENRFATIANLHKIINLFKIKISRISNIYHRGTISIFIEEIKNEV